MIRTAILAGILLVMLSMAYSRPGALPSFDQAPAPVVEEENEARAEPLISKPEIHEEAAPVTRAETPAPTVEEPEIAAVTPEPIVPVREQASLPPALPSPVAAAPGHPVQLLPEEMRAPVRETASIAPLVSDDMPSPLAPQLPSAQDIVAAPAPLPEVHVPTRPVLMPRDLASRMTPGSAVAAEPEAAPAPVPEQRTASAANAPKFMTPEERSRELYRLAREMEDTFIQKMTQ